MLQRSFPSIKVMHQHPFYPPQRKYYLLARMELLVGGCVCVCGGGYCCRNCRESHTHLLPFPAASSCSSESLFTVTPLRRTETQVDIPHSSCHASMAAQHYPQQSTKNPYSHTHTRTHTGHACMHLQSMPYKCTYADMPAHPHVASDDITHVCICVHVSGEHYSRLTTHTHTHIHTWTEAMYPSHGMKRV